MLIPKLKFSQRILKRNKKPAAWGVLPSGGGVFILCRVGAGRFLFWGLAFTGITIYKTIRQFLLNSIVHLYIVKKYLQTSKHGKLF